MSLLADPIRGFQRSRLLVDLAAVVACIGLAGLWFTGEGNTSTTDSDESGFDQVDGVPETTVSEPFPIEAFSVSLWYTAPEPERVVVEQPPLAPRLRLLGIRDTDTGYLAMLLDETSDDIIEAVQGDDINGVVVTSIDETGVRGTYRGSQVELRLDGGDG